MPAATAREESHADQLSFMHRPTGKWKLNLVRPKDIKTAVRALHRLLPPGRVAVNLRVEED